MINKNNLIQWIQPRKDKSSIIYQASQSQKISDCPASGLRNKPSRLSSQAPIYYSIKFHTVICQKKKHFKSSVSERERECVSEAAEEGSRVIGSDWGIDYWQI